ncbi:MAG: M48 family metallopeptidase [Proteobacteria bacterium]|nr:M48 family metallopeptidase [Pseudomonadota bacterium]
MEWNIWTIIFAGLFLLRGGFELALDFLQDRHLKNRCDKVPKHLKGKVDLETIRKAVSYNRDKLHVGMAVRLHSTVAVWAMILLGFGLFDDIVAGFGLGTLLSGLVFFGLIGATGFIWNLPVDLISTFGVEARHGFNRQNYLGFVTDNLKEILISLIMSAALLTVVLLLMENGGDLWWIYAYAGVTGIQLLVAWIFPLVIMPLFNRFTPVSPDLAADVSILAKAVGFPLAGVMSMDGSRRSAHSNAFIIGLKGARRIVLYDTLMNRVSRAELLAVLAHEFGHFKLKHLRRRLGLILVSLFTLFAALAYLREQSSIYHGLGFERPSDYAALVVFTLFVSEALAPTGWLLRFLSRRDEFAADRFATEAVGNGGDLKDALIALTKQNLASPGSHRIYRSYHNSHPALKQRLKAITEHAKSKGLTRIHSDRSVDPSV